MVHKFWDDILVQEYLQLGSDMHKVVLAAENEEVLKETARKLSENDIKHVLWVENPENIPTCLATKPYERELLQPFFKDLKLFR